MLASVDASRPAPTPSSGCVPTTLSNLKIHPPPLSAKRHSSNKNSRKNKEDSSDDSDDSDDDSDDDKHDSGLSHRLKFALMKSSRTGKVREGFVMQTKDKKKSPSSKDESDESDSDDESDDTDDDDVKTKKSAVKFKRHQFKEPKKVLNLISHIF